MTRVVLVHGFTQTGRSWEPVVERLVARLGAGVDVVTPDLPGHGTAAAVRTSFVDTARALGHEGGRAVYVGYSLGGRLVLRLGCDRPELVAGLVTIGATAGLDSPADQAERVTDDERLADSIERDGVDAFLDRWLRQPLFATLPIEAAGLDERRANTPAGLAAALRLLGTGTMEPLWIRLPTLGRLGVPIRFVAGALDAKFAATAQLLARAAGPPARVHLVAGAGHAAHLERPDELADVVADVVTEAATTTARARRPTRGR